MIKIRPDCLVCWCLRKFIAPFVSLTFGSVESLVKYRGASPFVVIQAVFEISKGVVVCNAGISAVLSKKRGLDIVWVQSDFVCF